MKVRHVQAFRTDARVTLQLCGVQLGAQFSTLREAQLQALAGERYRLYHDNPQQPALRMFHTTLQRRAK